VTAPQQQTPSLLDLEHIDRVDPERRGPVTFADDESLQRRLDRRGADRRRQERRGVPTPSPDLGVRELCHDLRQPLASAVVLTHMLERETGLTSAGRSRLEVLQAELVRLADMLSAQLEPAAPTFVDLAAVGRGVCCAPTEPAVVPVELVVEAAPLVVGDDAQLRRLVANLVSNARSAAGARGRVRVHIGSGNDGARIAVEDSGDAAGPPSTSGFGLGLLIVDAVVRRHGGSSVCRASPLGGLEVAVTLPAAPPQQAGGGRS
jgi:two-component system, OmpR family, sensor kinase